MLEWKMKYTTRIETKRYHVSEVIKYMMSFRNVTPKELSHMIGVSESAICQYRKHKKIPSLLIMIKIAEKLDMSLDLLVATKRRV